MSTVFIYRHIFPLRSFGWAREHDAIFHVYFMLYWLYYIVHRRPLDRRAVCPRHKSSVTHTLRSQRLCRRLPRRCWQWHENSTCAVITVVTVNWLQVWFWLSDSALTWLVLSYWPKSMCSSRSGIILSYTSSHRCSTGLSFGPNPFLMLTSPVSLIADTFGVGIQECADDTQLHISLTLTYMHAPCTTVATLWLPVCYA